MKKKRDHHSVEVIDIRGGDCRKTGEGAKGATYDETLALFRQAKRLEVPDKRASFIVDLHDPDGNLVDTAMIDARGALRYASVREVAEDFRRSERAVRLLAKASTRDLDFLRRFRRPTCRK